MKKLIFLVLLMAISHKTAFSQGCLPEGITFTAQAQIDSFQINYPGCTEIEGDVIIGGMFSGITNLEGLNILTSIGGCLDMSWVGSSNLSGLDNLVSIGGNLRINWGYSLTSLDGLENLTEIGGDFLLFNNYSLPSLTGLDNLIAIGGDFKIGNGFGVYSSGNDSLTSLTGLANLISIGGGLWIEGNYLLDNISALNNLTSVGGSISILGNGSLTSLSGLDNINAASITNLRICKNFGLSNCNILSICNYLSSPNGIVDIYDNAPGCNDPPEIASVCGISLPCLPYGNYYFFSQADLDNFQTNYPGCNELGGDVDITGNDIVSIDGLNQVTSIGGRLLIGEYSFPLVGNPLLNSLTGLENLTSIGGDLWLGHNDSLASLAGLDNLASLGGSLLIGLTWGGSSKSTASMKTLTSIEALRNLSIIPGELYIASTALTSLYGLDSVSFIGSNILIAGNGLLTDISSLNKLTSVNGGMQIGSIGIQDFTGLNNISSITGNVIISENNRLKNFEGLESLAFIGSDAWIYGNDSLTSLEGLNNLEIIDGYLSLCHNPSLLSLSGLENLDSIGSYLQICQNGLTSLSALSGLRSIKENLKINNNDNLTSLSGLDNVFTDSLVELRIFNNALLQTCDVQSICDYLADPLGNVEIYENAPGCNSPEEVEAACNEVSIESIVLEDGFLLFPNPAGKTVTVSGNNGVAIREIIIYNQTGQKVLQSKPANSTLDISKLKPGMYIIELLTNQGKMREKLIVE